MRGRLRFSLLGPVRAWRNGEDVELGPPQQRAVLAVLLAHPDQPVPITQIVDVLWWRDPPDSALNTVHRMIGQLRRALEPELGPREEGSWLVRGGGGYRLRVDADSADLLQFRDLVARARASRGVAAQSYARALQLWHGPVADGIGAEARERPFFTAIEREYVVAAREAADVALAARDDELLPLVELAADRAILDEPLQARLVSLLALVGRQRDALARFDAVRDRLRDDLGLDPGGELASARDVVLRPLHVAPRTTEELPRPAQLPADLPAFVGRSAEIEAIRTYALPGRSVVVTAIGGMAGIGKTSFAVHWAHQIADQFPDGQLYANLRGFDPGGAAALPGDVLMSFLEALGVSSERIPHGLDARAALFRSKLAGRRFLVVLDNARDTMHVRPLLPGAATSLVMVTSRDTLAGLVASQGAWPIVLTPMDDVEAWALLSTRMGRARLLAEPEAVEQIVAACAGLPIGLTVVAARAATRPQLSLREVSAGLHDSAQRLDILTTGDPLTDVRAVFSWSYHALTDTAARLFRLLGLHTAPDISADAAASLVGLTRARLQDPLAKLAEAALVVKRTDGRYEMHDLMRSYARETAGHTDPLAERQAAIARLVDHYMQAAYTAARLINPARMAMSWTEPLAQVILPTLSARAGAFAWFEGEHQALLAAVDLAAGNGLDRPAARLAWALSGFFMVSAHWDDLVRAATSGSTAARRTGDNEAEATALRERANAFTLLDRLDDALADMERSAILSREIDDLVGLGKAYLGIGMVNDRRRQHRESLHYAELAIDAFRRSGQQHDEAKALNAAGWAHTQLGEHDLARNLCQRHCPCWRPSATDSARRSPWTASAAPTSSSVTTTRPSVASTAALSTSGSSATATASPPC